MLIFNWARNAQEYYLILTGRSKRSDRLSCTEEFTDKLSRWVHNDN